MNTCKICSQLVSLFQAYVDKAFCTYNCVSFVETVQEN